MASQTQTDDMQPDIGMRIKTIRQERGLTLTDVAERSNLSASHLSQIERDKVTPSLMTLASISKSLDVNIRDLFESDGDQVHISRLNNGHVAVEPRTTLTSNGSQQTLEVERLVLQPGALPLEFDSYAGEGLGFVLSGSMEVRADQEVFVLEQGDSIHYDAGDRYCLRCLSEEPCTVIWCNSPPRKREPSTCQSGANDDVSALSNPLGNRASL